MSDILFLKDKNNNLTLSNLQSKVKNGEYDNILSDCDFVIYTSDSGFINVSGTNGVNAILNQISPSDFNELILESSTENSLKKFKIQINDNGQLSATELSNDESSGG